MDDYCRKLKPVKQWRGISIDEGHCLPPSELEDWVYQHSYPLMHNKDWYFWLQCLYTPNYQYWNVSFFVKNNMTLCNFLWSCKIEDRIQETIDPFWQIQHVRPFNLHTFIRGIPTSACTLYSWSNATSVTFGCGNHILAACKLIYARRIHSSKSKAPFVTTWSMNPCGWCCVIPLQD